MAVTERMPWYVAGLCFKCQGCGACCSGPAEGYIWVTRPEVELIADCLEISVSRLRRQYLKRVGLRTTIIEHEYTKDCVFLRKIDDQRQCIIYPVRPSQCRTWPFWADNLKNASNWNKAARKCPGINRGRLYTREQIEQIKNKKKWWQDGKQQPDIEESS